MIPRLIHFCWFGGNPKTELVGKCMESWTRVLPDFKVIEWNENNFDLSLSAYAQEAYLMRKWAFVTDYVRMWALCNHGGIYFDSDVEALKGFDEFLGHGGFTGFEVYDGVFSPFTAVLGSQKGHPLIAELLATYTGRSFRRADGSPDLTPNTKIITEHFIQKYRVSTNNLHQILPGDFHIYPSHYFCERGPSSYSTHHFAGSWGPKGVRLVRFKSFVLKNVPLAKELNTLRKRFRFC